MLPKKCDKEVYFLFLSCNKEHLSSVRDWSYTGTVTISCESETWAEIKRELATDPSDSLDRCAKQHYSLACLILGSRLWHAPTRRERFSFPLLSPWPCFGQVFRPRCSFPNWIKSPGERKLKLKTLVEVHLFLQTQHRSTVVHMNLQPNASVDASISTNREAGQFPLIRASSFATALYLVFLLCSFVHCFLGPSGNYAINFVLVWHKVPFFVRLDFNTRECYLGLSSDGCHVADLFRAQRVDDGTLSHVGVANEAHADLFLVRVELSDADDRKQTEGENFSSWPTRQNILASTDPTWKQSSPKFQFCPYTTRPKVREGSRFAFYSTKLVFRFPK